MKGFMPNFELIVEARGGIQLPLVTSGVTLTTDRKAPGKLTFTVVKDAAADFHEGNAVRLTVDGHRMFYGFVFKKKRSKKQHIQCTCYDQLRYLMNKDTITYSNLTADGLIRRIAGDYNLQVGELENTSFNIVNRVEDNEMLFDMIHNALDLELTNNNKLYVLYDDNGRVTLKSLEEMKLNIVVDDEVAEDFDYSSSIDDDTYNRVKLSYENDETGERDVFVVQDGHNINNWGILQYYDTIKKGENGEKKATALLDLYNAKSRKLKILNAICDPRVRGGSLVIVTLALGDINVNHYMLVERVTHKFNANKSERVMDLTLRGGMLNG